MRGGEEQLEGERGWGKKRGAVGGRKVGREEGDGEGESTESQMKRTSFLSFHPLAPSHRR